ncbi:hypothetical protein GCK72_000164 [Caenorhabditis remanei]|uniref:Uncharacterized protein n=1 Tax=Caenorhabditis remanei TaxID=31234 RepID=A0A6A5HRI5_CAERE|nr:hypothetical protein GCK72_000164 [Caenorhabditis remanei]KAF1768352.1 hypothetical protein GCK72_000164 [Caenorhabditis remanei]
MKEVKWYLVNLHITIILFDYTVGLLTMPFVLLPAFAWYTLGLLQYYGISLIGQAILFLGLCGFMITAIIVLFESRFFIVCEFRGKHYWSMIRRKWIAFLYVIVILYFVPFKYLCPDQEPAKQRLFERLPCLPSYIYNAPIFVLVEDLTYHLGVIIVWISVCFIGLIFQLIYIHWNTVQQLKTQRMSRKTYLMQRNFFFALVIQLAIPLCTIIGPALAALFSIIVLTYRVRTPSQMSLARTGKR